MKPNSLRIATEPRVASAEIQFDPLEVERDAAAARADQFELNREWDGEIQIDWGKVPNVRPEVERATAPLVERIRVSVSDIATVPELVAKVIPALALRDVFQRSQSIVHVVRLPEVDDDGVHKSGPPRVRGLPRQLLINELKEAVCFYKTSFDGKGTQQETECDPPADLVTTIIDSGEWDHIRPLLGIAHWPVLRRDGSIAQVSGYDARTQYMLNDLPEIDFPSSPTREDAEAAAKELLSLIEQFPIENAAQRTVWLCGILTPIARPAIKGPIPGIYYDASAPGSGKTLLAHLNAAIVTGHRANLRAAPKEESEWNRALLAIARSGAPIVLFDNLKGNVNSGAFEAVLTSGTFSERRLRTNDDENADVQTLFLLTANNAKITIDLSRRLLHCRLVSNEERPELREGFAIPDVFEYAVANRPHLLGCVLTILEAYRLAGSPPVQMRSMGSFEAWSAIVRAPLIWAGCTDPAGTQDALRDSASSELEEIADTAEAWLACFGAQPMTAKRVAALIDRKPEDAPANEKAALAKLAKLAPALRAACAVPAPKPLTSKMIGNTLADHRDKVLPNGLRFVRAGTQQRATLWRVLESESVSQGESLPQ